MVVGPNFSRSGVQESLLTQVQPKATIHNSADHLEDKVAEVYVPWHRAHLGSSPTPHS